MSFNVTRLLGVATLILRILLPISSIAGIKRLHRRLDLGARDGGVGEVRWDMTNNAGENVPNGLYLYVIEGKRGKVSGRFFVIQQ